MWMAAGVLVVGRHLLETATWTHGEMGFEDSPAVYELWQCDPGQVTLSLHFLIHTVTVIPTLWDCHKGERR